MCVQHKAEGQEVRNNSTRQGKGEGGRETLVAKAT
jgi:hypothetical protein